MKKLLVILIPIMMIIFSCSHSNKSVYYVKEKLGAPVMSEDCKVAEFCLAYGQRIQQIEDIKKITSRNNYILFEFYGTKYLVDKKYLSNIEPEYIVETIDTFRVPEEYYKDDHQDGNRELARAKILPLFSQPLKGIGKLKLGERADNIVVDNLLLKYPAKKIISKSGPQGGERWDEYDCEGLSYTIVKSDHPMVMNIEIEDSDIELNNGIKIGMSKNIIIDIFGGLRPMVDENWISYSYENRILAMKFNGNTLEKIGLLVFLWD